MPSLPLLGGLGRPAFGPRGPTMRQLSRIYDPGLVSLLVPGMVVDR
jgi:phospholipid/cholesterol/gamma-HCH transport system substrate-binding protein